MESRDDMNWRKASYSAEGGGNCIEVGQTAGTLLIRDTANRDGAQLRLTRGDFRRLTSIIKQDTL